MLDIWSHYFEFIPEGEIDSPQPTVLGAHELAEGKSYYILPTTAYGLYRYHISDLVRVTGFFGRTPLVEFLGKGHRFANLTGEKLSEYHVTKAMDAVATRVPQPVTAYSLAPVWDDEQPYYGALPRRAGRGRRARPAAVPGGVRPATRRGEHRVRGEARERPARAGARGADPGRRVGRVGPRPPRADRRLARSSTSTRA